MHPELGLDKWSGSYAARTLGSKSSPVRDLMGAIARPDIISFAGGFPETSIFERRDLMAVAEEVLGRDGKQALQYGPSEGYLALKECICSLLEAEGVHAHADEILVTGGAQQALDLMGKVFLDPGDPVMIEEPCYVGAINAFAGYQAEFLTIPMDDDGLQVDLVESELANGAKPKFLYLVPNFHNPAGVTLSGERRKRLIELARDFDLLILEDNPYGRIRFSGEDLPTLRSLHQEVVYLGSFSKIFSPGVRVGWVLAPHAIMEKLIVAKQSADLCSSSLTQRLVETFFRRDLWQAHLARLVRIYRQRCRAMLEALDRYFPPEAHWTRPSGGFYVWVTLPSYINTTEMLAEAIDHKVAYIPGAAFYPNGRGTDSMRLNFSYSEPETIERGIKSLAEVVKDQMSLYKSIVGEQ